MIKRLVLLTLIVMATLTALVLLWQFRLMVVFFFLSLAVAAAARPFITRLVKRGVPLSLALLLVYFVTFGSFGLLFFLIGDPLIRELQRLTNDLAVAYELIIPRWSEGSAFQQAVALRLPAPAVLFSAIAGSEGQLVLPAVLGLTRGLLDLVAGVAVVVVLSIYWGADRLHFERLWLSVLPAEQRKRAREIWRAIEPDIGAYIRSEVTQSLLAGILLTLGYWALGLRYPTLLGLFGAIAWLIPIVGVLLALIPPILVGLITGWQLALYGTLLTLAVLIILELWVEPRLFNRRQYGSILTMLIIISLADAYGLIGIIVAPPLSAVIQIIFARLVSQRSLTTTAAPATQVVELKERLAKVRQSMTTLAAEPPKEMASIMARLSQLITEAEPVLLAELPLQANGSPPLPGKGAGH